MTDDELATALLVSRLRSEGLHPLKSAEYWALCDRIGRPSAVLGRTEQDLVAAHGLPGDLASRIASLVDRATAMAFELDDLAQSGVSAVTPFDDHYPQRFVARLGTKAPPLLYAAGDVGLFDAPGVGVVGSRDVSADGGEVARMMAHTAARLGRSLVSGAARGVDQLAMSAAFDAGGTVVAILADSLLRTLRRPDVRRAVHEGNIVLCTPYSPDAPFTAGIAMGRNKLVYAQSHVTVVVASDDGTGGTWSGATEALKETYGRVAVWRGRGEGPGNERLQVRGAVGITSHDELERLLAEAEPIAAGRSVAQPSLFDDG